MDNKKVIGNPVATTMPFLELLKTKIDKEDGKGLSTNDFTNEDKEKLESIPRYISQLIDDTGGVFYIRFAYGADHALNDINLNPIHETYATKEEIPKQLSDIIDDTNPGTRGVNYAYNARLADQAYCDGRNNIITDTYATKSELAEAIGEALEGDY